VRNSAGATAMESARRSVFAFDDIKVTLPAEASGTN